MKLLSEKLQEAGLFESDEVLTVQPGSHCRVISGEHKGKSCQVTSLTGDVALVTFHDDKAANGGTHSDNVQTEEVPVSDLEVVTEPMVSEAEDFGGDPTMVELRDMMVEFADDVDPFENVTSDDTRVEPTTKTKKGYIYHDFTNLGYIEGTGITLGDKKTQNAFERTSEKVHADVRDAFIKKHKELFDGELSDLTKSTFLRGDLEDLGKDELAEELNEMEMDALRGITVDINVEISFPSTVKESGKAKALLTFHINDNQVSVPYMKQFKFKDMQDFLIQAGTQLDYIKKFI